MTGVLAAIMAAGDVLKITDQTIDDFQASPAAANTSYTLTNAGVAQKTIGAAVTTIENWLSPGSNAGLYEVMVTLNTGSLDSGTTGSWISLGTTRVWNVNIPGAGNQAANLTIQIRLAANALVVASATINLHCNSS